jgi:hypothetical protein
MGNGFAGGPAAPGHSGFLGPKGIAMKTLTLNENLVLDRTYSVLVGGTEAAGDGTPAWAGRNGGELRMKEEPPGVS